MRKLALVVLAGTLIPVVPGPSAVAADRPAPIERAVLRAEGPTSAIIHARSALDDAIGAARAAGLETGSRYGSIGVFVAYGTSGEFRELAQSSTIEAVEANRRLRLFTDSSHDATRGNALLDGSYGSIFDGTGVGVAIVDSGIDGTHPALSDHVVQNVKIVCASHVSSVYVDPLLGPDQCIHPQGKVAVPLDDTDSPSAGGHGTHVAGIIGSYQVDEDGMNGFDAPYHGAAPGASLYGVSIGTAVTVENALDGMQWVLDRNAAALPEEPLPIRVVNNSWGTDVHKRYPADGPKEGDFYYATWKMQDALVAGGVTVVQAAGNTGGDGTAATTSPQCVNPTPGVVCVANYYDGDVGARDRWIDGSSSRGQADPSFVDTWPDVSAPGTRIVSTCRVTLPICSGSVETDGHVEDPPNRYARLTGTSMAAPHVAGIVAQLLQADPSLTPADVENVLEDTAYKFMWGAPYTFVDPMNPDDASSYEKGHGLVDAFAAVRHVLEGQEPDPDPSPTWSPEPDPTLPPAGPQQTFYFHSTAALNQADQSAGTNTFDTNRPGRIAASTDTPVLAGLPQTDSMWTGMVEGPIQSLRVGFWQKTTDESTGSFGVYPFYGVTLEVGAGADVERYDLGTITVKTDGSELPATRVTGSFTRYYVADGPDPDGAVDSVPLNVDPQGRPVTLKLSSGWFHGFGAILYDSAQFPSGFSVNPPAACPDPGTPTVTEVGIALEQDLYLHSTSRNGVADAPVGGTTFDDSVPTAAESARFDDVAFARNVGPGGTLDPNWTGEIDGVICSLRVELWQKQLLGEAIGQADYLPALWVGDQKVDLPPIHVVLPMNFDELSRVTFTIDQMLDERGFVVPLIIDPAGQPITIELAGRYIDADVSTVIHYDSEARPSSFVVNEGYLAPRLPTTLTLEVLGAGGKRSLEATLVDGSSGDAVADQFIRFLVDGVEIGGAPTAADGRAILTPTEKFPGHHRFEAVFEGTFELGPSQATRAT